MQPHLPFLDLRSYRFSSLRNDLLASVTVTFLDIPQGVAYSINYCDGAQHYCQ